MNWKKSIKAALFLFIGWIGKSLYDNKLEATILTTWDKGVKLFNWAGLSFLKILNFELKVWWLILILAFAYIIKLLKINRTKNSEKTSFLKIEEYTEDIIKGYKWKWIWIWNTFEGKYFIDNLVLICPGCETHSEYVNSNHHSCPRCSERFSNTPPRSNIEKLIRDNCRRKIEESKVV